MSAFLRSVPEYEMNSFEILNGRRTTQVEEVPANTNIPRAVALAGRDVNERMFDVGCFAQQGATWLGLLKLAKLLLAVFINGCEKLRLRATRNRRSLPPAVMAERLQGW
jgi:hypothetical protein